MRSHDLALSIALFSSSYTAARLKGAPRRGEANLRVEGMVCSSCRMPVPKRRRDSCTARGQRSGAKSDWSTSGEGEHQSAE